MEHRRFTTHDPCTIAGALDKKEMRGAPNGPLLVMAARVAIVALVTLCGILCSISAMPAHAASGDDSKTVTTADPVTFALDDQIAYCVDPELGYPSVGTVLHGWNSGSYALDWVLYHSPGGPGEQMGNRGAMLRVVYAVGQDNPYWCYYTNTGYQLPEEDAAFFRRLYDQAKAFEAAGGRGPERGTSRIYNSANGTQRLALAAVGSIDITKISTMPELTDGNANYSLEGATYAIYRDEACTDEVEGARMTTDANGHASSVALGAATDTAYYIKEISASTGFEVSLGTTMVWVSPNGTTHVDLYETPKAGNIRISKQSQGMADVSINANYSLEGAVYGIYSSEACTDDTLVSQVTTDAEGHGLAENLAAGTYWIKEKVASAGHSLDPTPYRVQVESGQTSEVTSNEQQLYGWLDIVKTSHSPAITSGNACYDLAGARFGIYADADCTQLVQTLTLTRSNDGQSATAKSGDLVAQDYWVRELSDGIPEGYLLDTKTYPVSVGLGTTARVNAGAGGTVVDVPAHAKLSALVAKVDAEGNPLGVNGAQGGATLEGAVFEVRYYAAYVDQVQNLPARPTRTWRFVTDAQGEVHLDDASYLQSGDPLFSLANQDAPVLPLGTYAIQELTAPAGYWLEGQNAAGTYVAPTHLSQVVRDESTQTGAHVVDLNWNSSIHIPHTDFGQRAVADNVKRAGISLRKVDRQTREAAPQAGANLAGITFAIYNRNQNPIVCAGEVFSPGEEVVPLRMVTDASGKASTAADALPIGTYEVREISSNGTYLLDSEPQTITLGEGDAHSVRALSQPFDNAVVRGGVRVGKIDLQNGHHAPQGAGSFEGVVIGVRLRAHDTSGEAQRVAIVDGHQVRPGEVACTITLDTEGVGQTDDHALPYGSWELVELSVPRNSGYLINADWCQPFDIHEEGTVVDLSPDNTSVSNLVKRSDLRAVKAEESSQGRLARIPFVIVSQTTGEWHVIVTDLNGQLDTSSGWASRQSGSANANDAAVARSDDGSFTLVDASKIDDEAGVWFSGRAEAENQIPPNDAMGALPYDDYRLVELRVSANDAEVTGGSSNVGSALVEVQAKVYRNGAVIELGTIDNQPSPSIGTFLHNGNNVQSAAPESEVNLVDTVSYQNLVVGETYTLKGELHLLEADGSDGGVVAFAETTFRASVSTGTVPVEFTFDASELSGRSAVAFERLLCSGIELASHADLSDEGQTISFPSIGTTLVDEQGSHEAPAYGTVTLVDSVSYEGLCPGESYEVTGTLVDKETGEPVELDGVPVRSSTTFVATESSGVAEVCFEVDGSLLAGRTVVAFESLLQKGVELAIHANIEDEAQTVSFPAVGTTLCDASGTSHEVAAGPTVLVDTVSYQNLVVGQTYELHGTLWDRATSEPIPAAESDDAESGVALSSVVEFVPEEPSGTVEVPFSLDASALGGHELVAFEELVRDGSVVAKHCDLDDEGQTVRVPVIGTTLSSIDAKDLHEGFASNEITLVDTVSFTGLTPGNEYLVVGKLYDQTSGEPLVIDEEEVTSSASFTPETTDGTVDVTFTFDASQLAGRTVVAFERLMREERELAVHADINDVAQSFRFPAIGTTFTDETGSHEVPSVGTVKLTDHVAYQNLEPEASYVATCTLMDRATGQPLNDGSANMTKTVSFIPEAADGVVDLTFELDATQLAGRSVVAFELLGRDGRTVASHEDLNDEGQTLTFPKIGTSLVDAESGKKALEAIGTVRLRDTVAYLGLTPGIEYRVVGTLMNKETGEPITVDEAPISVATTFIPTRPNGITEVVFEVDAGSLANKSVVAFEVLMLDTRVLATHEDITDENQTVSFGDAPKPPTPPILNPPTPETPPTPENPPTPVIPPTPETPSTPPTTPPASSQTTTTVKEKVTEVVSPRTGDLFMPWPGFVVAGATALMLGIASRAKTPRARDGKQRKAGKAQ